MSPRAPATVTLAGETFVIRPLTLAQVEAIDGIVNGGGSLVVQASRIVGIGLEREHASAAAALSGMEISASEIGEAMAVVLRQGGFLPSGGAPAAAGTDASTGAPFAAG